MTDPRTSEVDARAKINLFLRVLGRRDDGYHDVETLAVPISLADRVRVHAHSDPTQFRTLALELEVVGDPALTAGVPVDDTNLALRAAAALADRTRARGFAEITVEKRVPSAAGMGGGSADAAAVLRVLNELWGCHLSDAELRDVGADVGADVPALLDGGPVVARGRGEAVEPVDVAAFRWVVLPLGFTVATRDAYDWWDEEGVAGGRGADSVVAAAAVGDARALARLMSNDLEEPVIRHHPEIADARRRVLEAGALRAMVTGSGPTVVGLLDDGTSVDLPGASEVMSAGHSRSGRPGSPDR